MPVRFSSLFAMEILDSRGRPTIAVRATLASGATVHAGVPSGASTGSCEAVELRDRDPIRYGGLGVGSAVSHVNGPIAQALVGHSFDTLEQLDAELIALDGTDNKSRLGANAIVGVSIAAARAFAAESGQPLWRWLQPDAGVARLPVPHFNVVNGGAHARNALDFQEFMIAPLGVPSMAEAIRAGAETYLALRGELIKRNLATGLGDEGGFAPEIAAPEDVLELLLEAITTAGYTPGPSGVAIALDPAASEFHRDGRYVLEGEGSVKTSDEMIEFWDEWVTQYPIVSIEDGLDESDWTAGRS